MDVTSCPVPAKMYQILESKILGLKPAPSPDTFLSSELEGSLGGAEGGDAGLGCRRPASGLHLPLPSSTCAKRALGSSLEYSI